MNDILFTEQQRFRQWWLWLILLGVNVLLLSGLYKQVILGQQFGGKAMSNLVFSITALIVVLITILFFIFRLETRVTKEGIYVQFFPFHTSFKYYAWAELSRSFVRQYDPVNEYGGWGLRLGLFGGGKAYNVSGNQGLQLEFSDNKKLLIGTNKPEELAATLNSLGQLKA